MSVAVTRSDEIQNLNSAIALTLNVALGINPLSACSMRHRSLLHPNAGYQNLMAHILVAASPAPGHVNPMLLVAQHLYSLGHSITFLSGKLFHDQAAASRFRFVPLSGKADYDYKRMYDDFPEIATAQTGSRGNERHMYLHRH